MKRLLLFGLAAVIANAATSAQSTAPSTGRNIPAPASVLGFEPCADYRLGSYEQISQYLRVLDEASERIQLVNIGQTTEGRTQLMAVISSAANMHRLPYFKSASQRLALASNLTPSEAHELASEARSVVWIDFGLHSTEVAHAQVAPQLAFYAVTDESPEMQSIRDNVILLLLPNMNPDGTSLVANWYASHVGTPFERTSPVELYQRYAGHDNNRDWFMFNLAESRNVATQLYREWFPQIVYNHHQSAPFPARIFVPPFTDPMNPNIPQLVMRGINLAGESISRRLEQEGKTGVISRINYDTWWNGGMRTAAYYHNMVGLLTETSHPWANPSVYDDSLFPDTFSDGRSTRTPSTYYPNPYRGGEWHLSDSCDYMLTASMAVLDLGAKRRTEWTYDMYRMGQESIEAGKRELYVVSRKQWDLGAAIKLINTLRWGGIEIERTTRSLTIGGTTYPPNSFVIRGAQSFRPYLSDLLNPQVYPDMPQHSDGRPDRPYDITGWTLPMQMGVTVDRHFDVDRLPADSVVSVDRAVLNSTRLRPSTGFAYALDPRRNDAFLAVNRLLLNDHPVYRTTSAVKLETATWPAGTFILPIHSDTTAAVDLATQDLGLIVESVDRKPDQPLTQLTQPQIGIYRSWRPNPDEGWTRLVLETFEFPYRRLLNEDVRNGNLSNLDVILLPDATYTEILNGLGRRAAPPQYQGGITSQGVSHLYNFVKAGGVLVTFDSASELPLVDFELPILDISKGYSANDYYVPGSLLEIIINSTHPIGYGMPPRASGFFSRSPVFLVTNQTGPDGAMEPANQNVSVVARYPEADMLLSGSLVGEKLLSNKAIVVEARLGRGKVILLGLRAQHRGQTYGTYKLLFNSLFLKAFL